MTHLKTMRVQFADAQTSSGTRGGTREFVPSEVTNSTFTLEGQVHYEKEFGQVFFFFLGSDLTGLCQPRPAHISNTSH